MGLKTENLEQYIHELAELLQTGHAREHAYRPALERLMNSFDDTLAVNDPARSENGNPDFVFLKRSNKDMILGYAEAKDITVDLDKTLKTEQLRRYAGYEKLFLTNYRDFIFLENGEEYERISLGGLSGGALKFDSGQAARLANELQAFLARSPESIRSGKRLAVIMGGKARRIRDNVREYLKNQQNEKNIELEKIYDLMKRSLVHDLTPEHFSDLYAQTLVYGLFAARYNDDTPGDFNRREAVECVPKTNPFLRQFFNHIAGADFDSRLRHIVDELCEVFAVSDIQGLVHKTVAKFAFDDERDATIHFYEDFLKEYDPAERKKMGVYYTPIPVVKYIVRSVDKILKEEFGIAKGLASTEEIDHWLETGQEYKERKNAKTSVTGYYKKVPRVQILDPAVGTATFLNETIKHIHKSFEGQEGRWPAYVKDNLIKRLHGFELMMAPYTIAHLKLSMTLQESGVKDLNDRLGVYLTNTLEEGVVAQQDLLMQLGLAGAVTEESRLAAEVKSEHPVMVVMGNPPYSVSSNNKSEWIQNLIKDYKKDLNERKINLDDDYIKFIRFAEDMIAKNGSGIVAMITNNSYIDGITHRQMRKHLLQTFDKIYVLDLHGNSKKKEVAPDGGKDENVFDIMQGVSVVLMVKTSKEKSELGEVYHAELWGERSHKFYELNQDKITFTKISSASPNYYFVSRDIKGEDEYQSFIPTNDLMPVNTSGIETQRDRFVILVSRKKVENNIRDLILLSPDELRQKYDLAPDGRNWTIDTAKKDVGSELDTNKIKEIAYRPFDIRFTYYTGTTNGIAAWPRFRSGLSHMLHENIGLVFKRGFDEYKAAPVGISNTLIDRRYWTRPGMQGAEVIAPLYVYHEDGTRTPNFAPAELECLMCNIPDFRLQDVGEGTDTDLPEHTFTPEDILDYIYAVLHSPSYRAKYKEFLKIDFPRIPPPADYDEFARLMTYGAELRELHLMQADVFYNTSYPIAGSDEVDKIVYTVDESSRYTSSDSNMRIIQECKLGRVYINDTQYFGNVPEIAWNFYIGGYQPAQKWLKDRKGRKLTSQEIDHYQKIIKILQETDRLMTQIG